MKTTRSTRKERHDNPSLAERSVAVWLLLGIVSCGATVHLGSRPNEYTSLGADIVNAAEPSYVPATYPSPTPTLTNMPKPAEVPEPSAGSVAKTEKQEVINYIVEVFGEEAPNAFNILYCENRGLDPQAINYNRNGTWDAGIFQVNQIHGHSLEEMQDYKKNIDAAKKIFDRAGGWSPWTCSTRIEVRSFWQ